MTTGIATGTTDKIALLPEPRSVPAARQWVRARLADRLPKVAEKAELITSEIVTNAIKHGSGDVVLKLTTFDGHLRFTVTDEGSETEPTIANAPAYGSLAEGGWGLQLLNYYETQWGTERLANGHRLVWFELSISPSNAAPASARDAPDRSLDQDPQEV